MQPACLQRDGGATRVALRRVAEQSPSRRLPRRPRELNVPHANFPQVWFITPEFRPIGPKLTYQEHIDALGTMIRQMAPKVGRWGRMAGGMGFWAAPGGGRCSAARRRAGHHDPPNGAQGGAVAGDLTLRSPPGP